jgi:Rieske Fe-S protein
MHLRNGTANQSVLLGPFLDETDGKTPETGLTIANTDIRLSKNGGNMAAKNSGGGTHDEAGYYTITLDGTDTGTVGRLQVSCQVSGALPVFMEFEVLTIAKYDEMYGSSAAALPTAAAIADAVWDEVQSGHVSAGSFGEIATEIAAILVDTNSLNDTKIPQTLNLTASGNIGIDWANVENPSSAVDLSATDIRLCDTITTYTGNTVQTGDSYALANGASGFVASKAVVDAILVDTAVIGAAGAGLTAIPWNAAWDAEVQSEVQDAIEVNHLDHLLAVDYDPASKPGVSTALLNELIGDDGGVSQFTANALELGPSGGGGGGGGDATEANQTTIIAHLTDIKGTSFVKDTHSLTDILADTAEIGAAGAGLTDLGGMSTGMKAEVESEVNDALVAIHLDHLLAVDYDPASKPGTSTALLNELIGDDGGVSQFTANALENATSATAAAIADAVWDELQAGHVTAGSFGEIATEIASILVDTAEIGAAGAGLTAVPWNASWDAEVQSECNDALVAIHLDHLLAVDYDPASKPGTSTSLLNEIFESDGGISRFTANALENAPGASAAAIADAVWDEAQSGHVSAGSFGEIATEIASILVDTAEIGAAGAGLTAVPWNASWDAEVQSEVNDALVAFNVMATTDLPSNFADLAITASTGRVDVSLIEGVDATDQIRDAIVDDATRIDASALNTLSGHDPGATLSSLTAAQVNAEVVDALDTDTYAELGAVPAATASLADKIAWLFMLARNKVTQTATTVVVRNDADSGNVATSTVSDDGTTATRGEFS